MNIKKIIKTILGKLRNLIEIYPFLYKDRLFFILLILGLILNIIIWVYWKTVINDTSKLIPIFYTTGLVIFNFLLAIIIYKKESAASYLALFITCLAEILLLVLLRYYFLVSGLL